MWFKFGKYNNSTLGGVLINLVIATGILLSLAVAYFYAYLPAITNHGESITVPNVEGMNISELEAALVQRNLRWEVNDSAYSEKYPPLTVLKQFPHAGSKVKENRTITISVNRKNPPSVPIPNLIDGSVINADAVLRTNELKRGKIEYVRGHFNTVKAMKYKGHIVPPETRVPKGSVIDLVVMDGGSTDMPAPDVVGMTLEDAKIPILGSDLNLGRINLIGDTTGVEAVILKQKPEAGENIKVGDIVDLWIGEPGSEIPEE